MRVRCEVLGNVFDLPRDPRRVVSLVSAATETAARLGLGERLVGVSPYCARYVDGLEAPVAGDYVQADLETLRALRPDLVLLTTGVQLPLARRCAAAGLPAYALPVPSSRHGVLENIRVTGALLDRVAAARDLADEVGAGLERIRTRARGPRPRVHVELWFGAHVRTAAGGTFVGDLVELAGGENLLGGDPRGYPPLDVAAATRARPDVVLWFSEPEHPVDFGRLALERGWAGSGAFRPIVSTVERGRNVIHDGPSYLETAEWLAAQLPG